MTSAPARQIDPTTEGPPDTSVAALTELPSEEALKHGVIDTRITRPVAWGMTVLFLSMVVAVPVAQAVYERWHGRGVQALDVFRQRPAKAALKAYEDELERSAV